MPGEDTSRTHAKLAQWAAILRLFVEQNAGRPTRLGVFRHEFNGVTDYWIESGVPFLGLDLDEVGGDVRATVTLGEVKHEVENVSGITLRLSTNADEEGIDLVDRLDSTSVLRFETEA